MKRLFLLASMTVLFGFAITACQSLSPLSANRTVLPEHLIPLESGQNAGWWRGEDISVDYGLAGTLISGTVRFNDHMTINFTFLRDFHLSAIFADRDGKVLGSQGLATNRGNLDPFPFRARLAAPPGTAFITFGYQGTAYSTGFEDSGGPTAFWGYPVY